ncbi:MAG: DUF5956 family protein [Aeromicrobium erythreum]
MSIESSDPGWSWEDYPVLAELPGEDSGFVVLDEMLDAILLSWFAGPRHVARCTDFVPRPGPRESAFGPDGGMVMVQREWTDADREGLDRHVDDELVEAGLPPRPHGYEWFLLAPGFASFEAVRALKNREFFFAPRSSAGAVKRVRWLVDHVVADLPAIGHRRP